MVIIVTRVSDASSRWINRLSPFDDEGHMLQSLSEQLVHFIRLRKNSEPRESVFACTWFVSFWQHTTRENVMHMCVVDVVRPYQGDDRE